MTRAPSLWKWHPSRRRGRQELDCSTERVEVVGQTEMPLTSRLDSITLTPLITARAPRACVHALQSAEGCREALEGGAAPTAEMSPLVATPLEISL